MSRAPLESESPSRPLSQMNWLAELANRFEAAWRTGQQPRIEQYLDDDSIPDRRQAVDQLLLLEVKWRRRQGDLPQLQELRARFPEFASAVHDALQTPFDNSDCRTLHDGHDDKKREEPPPKQLLRYRVTGTLGKGGFGIVYAAFDDELCRPVAIKVLHRKWISESDYVERYLAEARALAKLDHPHIVPIYDVGRTDDGRLLMVSKYLEGGSLAQRLRSGRLSFEQAARAVASIADALHHAHARGLVHRDVKAGNILLDAHDGAHISDFGLVLREEEFGTGPTFAGTPDYMSPEQARNEGHRVDGRSDIFSLGVVLYELLTGRRPFRAESRDELLDQIANVEARPPRQIDDHIPKELERICLKALTKPVGHRYTTALDFASDLQAFLASEQSFPSVGGSAPVTPALDSATRVSVKVIPKGLRSFDAADADFFLELLPGPRDRDGIPESVRFWQRRVTEVDGDRTIPVGLIYGPSGCGKSSLVKAGLLPRLPPHVRSIYMEAVDDATEDQLRARLRKLNPNIPSSAGLADILTQIRRGQLLPQGEKLLIVLDQFEQWLQARRPDADHELVRALRQCDGGRVQCLLLVRDDFWMAVTRLMRDIEVPIVENENAISVDLFDLRHARGVLSMIGRAHGVLPERVTEQSADESKFIDQAIRGLAQDEKIIPVRLALFSEMVKARPWIPATLKAIGGIEGVGLAFLEESFAATAPPARRLHAPAARAVLKALLPSHGKNIKGTMRSYAELFAASGYAERPDQFEELLRILHRDLRLISPSDAEGGSLDSTERRATPVGHQFYQLTHDYLVPALRDWLTRQQRETRRGRAELRLAECTARYEAKPNHRSLPSFFEWANIRLFTDAGHWSGSQQKIMRQSAWRYGLRAVVAALFAVIVWQAAWMYHGHEKAQSLHDRLLSASIDEVPRAVEAMRRYRTQIDPLLRSTLADAIAADDGPRRLRASMALLHTDAKQKEYLVDQLLIAPASDVGALVTTLKPSLGTLAPQLWREFANPGPSADRQLRAACALAVDNQKDSRWIKHRDTLVTQLLRERLDDTMLYWRPALHPLAESLLPCIEAEMIGESVDEMQRRTLLRLFHAFTSDRAKSLAYLETDFIAASKSLATMADHRLQANRGAALVALGRPGVVWPQLRHSQDPTLRSLLIERMTTLAVPIRELMDRLSTESDVSARRALILALGNYPREFIPETEREAIARQLLRLFEIDQDGGIHSAAEWTLRQWRFGDRLTPIVRGLATGKPVGDRRWFINPEGQTFVIIKGPVEFAFGPKNQRRIVTIPHSFAIATKEVTVAEYLRAFPKHEYTVRVAPTPDCPMNRVSWYHGAAYCNWLSQKEGGSKVYRPNSEGRFHDGMTIDSDFVNKNGYRLPTEYEWEFAAWAGATTALACGNVDDELVRKYGWTWPHSIDGDGIRMTAVASHKPNDLGLFDTFGNVTEWCQEKTWPDNFVGPIPDFELDDPVVSGSIGRVSRGESALDHANIHQHYRRLRLVPGYTGHQFGLRLVRALPPN